MFTSDFSLKSKILSKEYKKTEDPISGIASVFLERSESKTSFMFITSFDYTEGRLEKEVWDYPTISFIAEMGGSLGLFIGVSFLSVWDFGEFIFEKYKQFKN